MKERLDVILVQRGLIESREKAKTLIMTGNVFVNGQREDKAGTKIDVKADVIIKNNPIPYVSRGGLKLEKAIKVFNIYLKDKVCIDIGASTGGFTDCMLQNHAVKVYAIDVGYGQLDWKLRQDNRVICMEKTNVRYIEENQIGELVDFISIDVSFISLTKILNVVQSLLKASGEMVCLVKPQFEAGRNQVGKKGVVRDKKVHIEVLENIIQFVKGLNLVVMNLSYSPIKGAEGNIEYLLHVKKERQIDDNTINIKSIVDQAHNM